MNWTPQHLLAVIALIFFVISGGVIVFPVPNSGTHVAPGLMLVGCILLAIALLIS